MRRAWWCRRTDAPSQMRRKDQAIATGGRALGFLEHAAVVSARKLVPEPSQRQPTPADIGQRVPDARNHGTHHQKRAMLQVGREAVRATGQNRGSSSRVEKHAGHNDAGTQSASCGIATAGCYWRARTQAKITRRLLPHFAYDGPGLDNPGNRLRSTPSRAHNSSDHSPSRASASAVKWRKVGSMYASSAADRPVAPPRNRRA